MLPDDPALRSGAPPLLSHERRAPGGPVERFELFPDGRVVTQAGDRAEVTDRLDAGALGEVLAAISRARLSEVLPEVAPPDVPTERWVFRGEAGVDGADVTVRVDRRHYPIEALRAILARVLHAVRARADAGAASSWWMPYVSRLRLLMKRALLVAPLGAVGADALPQLLSGRGASEQDAERIERMRQALAQDGLFRGPLASDPLGHAARALGLTGAECDALLAVLLPELRADMAAAWAALQGDAVFVGVDERLLRAVLDPLGERTRDVAGALRRDATLLTLGALRPRLEPASGQTRLLASPGLRDFVAGVPGNTAEERARARMYEPPPVSPRLSDVPLFPLSDELRQEVREAFQSGETLVLRGPLRAGYTLLARQVAAERGAPLLELPMSRFTLPDELPALREAVLQAALRSGIVLARDLTALGAAELGGSSDEARPDATPRDAARDERTLVTVAELLRSVRGPLMVVAEDPLPASVLLALVERLPVRFVTVTAPDAAHRQALWGVRAGDVGREGGPDAPAAGHLAALDADEIERAVDLAVAMGGEPGRSEEASRRVATQRLRQLGLPVHSTATWDRVVLPEETLQTLAEIRRFGRFRQKVMLEWAFREQSGYGTGLSVLFSGPSGTGKTLVAGLLARDLGQALFQVDLSRLVSKFIGETEQRLAELFSAATSAGAALLFDEADSLFAQRTDVKTSVDRYANLEVNYLLQRMEAFEGVVILTTNFRQSIDQAFMRRIRFKVDFAAPEKDLRTRLWEVLLPSGAPVESGIDFGELGESFDLTGGEIRNAILRASLAAAEAEQPIDADLLFDAAVRECQETGKVTRVGVRE